MDKDSDFYLSFSMNQSSRDEDTATKSQFYSMRFQRKNTNDILDEFKIQPLSKVDSKEQLDFTTIEFCILYDLLNDKDFNEALSLVQ